MLLPAALPVSPAVPPTAQVPAETPEIGVEFAALLGLMLETGAADHAAPPAPATMPAPSVQPTIGSPDGKSLPEDLPPPPPTLDTQPPEADVLAAIIVPTVIAPITTPAIEPVVEPAPPPPASPPHRPAQLPDSTKTTSPALTQPQPPRPEQASAALPRLMLPVADEAASSPLIVPAQPRKAITAFEGTAAPTPTAPQLMFAVAEAPASSPAAVAAPNPGRAARPHDLATLVDRLVEARDTARAVQAPQTVSASLTHTDFGDIAIRFEHGGRALSVALSSPDPDFARAVQAAAPTAQAQAPNIDSNAAAGRQDPASQQQAGSPSGQSQQSQGQQPQAQQPPAQRSSGSLTRHTAPQANGRDAHSGRSGIFA